MATKKFLEIQELSNEDLTAELAESQRQYQKLKFDHAIKGLDNPMTLRGIRKDIARLKTEINRRAHLEA